MKSSPDMCRQEMSLLYRDKKEAEQFLLNYLEDRRAELKRHLDSVNLSLQVAKRRQQQNKLTKETEKLFEKYCKCSEPIMTTDKNECWRCKKPFFNL